MDQIYIYLHSTTTSSQRISLFSLLVNQHKKFKLYMHLMTHALMLFYITFINYLYIALLNYSFSKISSHQLNQHLHIQSQEIYRHCDMFFPKLYCTGHDGKISFQLKSNKYIHVKYIPTLHMYNTLGETKISPYHICHIPGQWQLSFQKWQKNYQSKR